MRALNRHSPGYFGSSSPSRPRSSIARPYSRFAATRDAEAKRASRSVGFASRRRFVSLAYRDRSKDSAASILAEHGFPVDGKRMRTRFSRRRQASRPFRVSHEPSAWNGAPDRAGRSVSDHELLDPVLRRLATLLVNLEELDREVRKLGLALPAQPLPGLARPLHLRKVAVFRREQVRVVREDRADVRVRAQPP